ncbi:MAG: hypothetical protein JRJ86_15180 [Deltaproteobacteria bacterium]|nr:hypothetical protein [Deltaproteobacteria bacterium]MBW2346003.1 hypothetical protein [Deltaproteobacteria bacterium]
MKGKSRIYSLLVLAISFIVLAMPVHARIKLVALPERGKTIIRLDNPRATLIEEERVLTLQKGVNKVDFSWKGVSIDADSIRLNVLTHPYKAILLGVGYPPNEAALVWEIHCDDAFEVTVRISYLLSNIDRLITYKGIADKTETKMNLKSYLVLRNFSGEDFENASVFLDDSLSFEQNVRHEETKQLLFLNKRGVSIEECWTFDAGKLPWDPEKLDINVGIPVSFRIRNTKDSGLGTFALYDGKVRVFQEDGHKSTIFLGEDTIRMVPVGETMKVYIGDSRDIVVTQHKLREKRINVRRNNKNRVVLYDTDELIKATIENFKDKPAILTMIEHIPGQWDMAECNMKYKRKDAHTLEFEIELPAHGKKELSMYYNRRNIR